MKRTMNISSPGRGLLSRLKQALGWKMAWNEPGKDDDRKDKDPWSGNNQDGPPDLDEVVKKMQQKFGGIFGKKGSGGRGNRGSSEPSGFGFYIVIAAVLAVLWLAYDMTYTIQQAERGVVLRFGKYADTMQPGLNFRLPRPIERVYKVDVKKIYNFTQKASMLTQDENIVELELFIQFQIAEPEKFLFNVRWPAGNPDTVLRSVMESSVREVTGKNKMDFVLTEGRTLIADRTRELIQSVLDGYGAGLLISELKLQYARPPEAVKAAFDDAIKAREDEVRQKNEAEAYRNDIIPKARGKSARVVADATAYKAQIVDQAKGDASRFEQLLTEYEKAPKVTRDRLYLETVEQVLSNNRKVMVDVEGGNNLMYLPLDRFMHQSGDQKTTANVPENRRMESSTTNRDEVIRSRRDTSRTGSVRR
jgi:membrane protease subunit HflK